MACSAVLAVALAGCGDQEGQTEPEASGPPIERPIATELADLSDEVARQLESGDPCGAAAAAARLREGVTAAINEGKVPEPYLEDLSGLANEIEVQIPECVESPPPDEGDEDRKKDKKDKKDHEEDD
ncbi:MAG TPA: hypothetical protein VGW30_04270 [Gaiellaceae bacterium]|nr:hypothetical protein [Gaiellaceae bacterium]